MTQVMTRKDNYNINNKFRNDKFSNDDYYSVNKLEEITDNNLKVTDFINTKQKYVSDIVRIVQNIDTIPFEYCVKVLRSHIEKNHKHGVWIPIKNTPFWSGGQSEVYILYKVFFEDNEINIRWGIAKNFNDKDNFKLENRMFNIIKRKCEERNSDIYKKYIPEKHGSIKTVINGKSKNFLVMEYVDGITLSKLIKEKKLNNKLIINIMIQLCEVISFFHEVGISHRDLKPQNIIIKRERQTINGRHVYDDDSVQVKIIDFGLSCYSKSKKKCKDSVGTINYCSPEIFSDDKNGYDPYKADLWSLGIIFYTMVCGHSAYITPVDNNDMFLDFVNEENYCNNDIFNIIIKGLCNLIPEQRYCPTRIIELLKFNYNDIINKK